MFWKIKQGLIQNYIKKTLLEKIIKRIRRIEIDKTAQM